MPNNSLGSTKGPASAALQIAAIVVVGTWVVLWPSWWSLISAMVLLVALMIGWKLSGRLTRSFGIFK